MAWKSKCSSKWKEALHDIFSYVSSGIKRKTNATLMSYFHDMVSDWFSQILLVYIQKHFLIKK